MIFFFSEPSQVLSRKRLYAVVQRTILVQSMKTFSEQRILITVLQMSKEMMFNVT